MRNNLHDKWGIAIDIDIGSIYKVDFYKNLTCYFVLVSTNQIAIMSIKLPRQ